MNTAPVLDPAVEIHFRLGSEIQWEIVAPAIEGRAPSRELLATLPETGRNLLIERWLDYISASFQSRFASELDRWIEHEPVFADIHLLFRDIQFSAADPFAARPSVSSWQVEWSCVEPRPLVIPEEELAARAMAAIDFGQAERIVYEGLLDAYHRSGRLLNVHASPTTSRAA